MALPALLIPILAGMATSAGIGAARGQTSAGEIGRNALIGGTTGAATGGLGALFGSSASAATAGATSTGAQQAAEMTFREMLAEAGKQSAKEAGTQIATEQAARATQPTVRTPRRDLIQQGQLANLQAPQSRLGARPDTGMQLLELMRNRRRGIV